MGGALAVMLALPMTGMWGMPLLQVSAAGDADDSSASQPETTVTKVQAEDAERSLEIGLDMSSQFVKEEEPNSDEGGHIKTSKIGATVTLTFEGTGIRFYTKCGNGAGKLSVRIDDGETQEINEYINSSTAQFKEMLYENLELSETK